MNDRERFYCPVAYLTDRLWVRARGSIGALLADLEGADQR